MPPREMRCRRPANVPAWTYVSTHKIDAPTAEETTAWLKDEIEAATRSGYSSSPPLPPVTSVSHNITTVIDSFFMSPRRAARSCVPLRNMCS